MKNYSKIIYVIFLILCNTHLLATPPNWYVNQSLLSESYEIIGYGEGSTLREAKEISKSDISKMIQTTISSSILISKNINIKIYYKNISTIIN